MAKIIGNFVIGHPLFVRTALYKVELLDIINVSFSIKNQGAILNHNFKLIKGNAIFFF